MDEIKPDDIKDTVPVSESDSHIDEVTGVMPEVVPEAVQAAADKEKEVKADQSNTYDAKGRQFDPAIHAVDKDGRPILTPTGRFKKLNRPASVLNTGAKEQEADLLQKRIDLERLHIAKAGVAMFLQVTTAIFGDEWKPEVDNGIDEHENLVLCTDEWLKQYPDVKLSPGMTLLLAVGIYASKRLPKPKTQTRLQKIGAWFHSKFAGFVAWKKAKEAKA